MTLPFPQHIPVTTRPRLQRLAEILGWRIAVPLLSVRARRRVARLVPGAVTVVTVNWNSWSHLLVLLEVVRRRSPTDTRIRVVDNGSLDGSRERLAGRRDVGALLLPVNVGHGLALDLGVLLCDTEYVVVLDVDAFPLSDRWLDELLAPLDAGAQITGARLNREYVHPCCWAMRTARFVEQRHSFRPYYRRTADGLDTWGDVGEAMSAREAPHLHFFDPTSQRGPGCVGTVFGDLVYHNFYATRFRATAESTLDGLQAADAALAWKEAVARYVG